MKLLDNNENILEDTIEDILKNCYKIQIAVAFIKESGVNKLFELMENTKLRIIPSKIEIIGGESFYNTESKALRKLKTKGINVRMVRGQQPTYHPKLYIFYSKEKYYVIIGSSNLSKGGLSENIELNILFKGDKKNKLIAKILNYYKEQKKVSVKVTERYLRSYEKKEKKIVKSKRDLNRTINKTEGKYRTKDKIFFDIVDMENQGVTKSAGEKIRRILYNLEKQLTPEVKKIDNRFEKAISKWNEIQSNTPRDHNWLSYVIKKHDPGISYIKLPQLHFVVSNDQIFIELYVPEAAKKHRENFGNNLVNNRKKIMKLIKGLDDYYIDYRLYRQDRIETYTESFTYGDLKEIEQHGLMKFSIGYLLDEDDIIEKELDYKTLAIKVFNDVYPIYKYFIKS